MGRPIKRSKPEDLPIAIINTMLSGLKAN